MMHENVEYAVIACTLPPAALLPYVDALCSYNHCPAMFAKQERWAEDDAEFWKPSNASAAPTAKTDGADAVRGRRYLPFGDGMRSCVGQSLAKMNYTATVALLLSHFSFRLADHVSPWCLTERLWSIGQDCEPTAYCHAAVWHYFDTSVLQMRVLRSCEAGLTKAVCCCRWEAQKGCKLLRFLALLSPPEMACGCMPCLEHDRMTTFMAPLSTEFMLLLVKPDA